MRMVLTRLHVYVEGLVQGVGFRAWTRATADSLGLEGWVKNLPDGRVEAVFEGDEGAVKQMLAELWRLDNATVRRIFETAPGVLRLGDDKRGNGKRGYFTLRIPASVAEREHRRMTSVSSETREVAL